jgi:hypothetical protein
VGGTLLCEEEPYRNCVGEVELGARSQQEAVKAVLP